jgi:hypothetical protein
MVDLVVGEIDGPCAIRIHHPDVVGTVALARKSNLAVRGRCVWPDCQSGNNDHKQTGDAAANPTKCKIQYWISVVFWGIHVFLISVGP